MHGDSGLLLSLRSDALILFYHGAFAVIVHSAVMMFVVAAMLLLMLGIGGWLILSSLCCDDACCCCYVVIDVGNRWMVNPEYTMKFHSTYPLLILDSSVVTLSSTKSELKPARTIYSKPNITKLSKPPPIVGHQNQQLMNKSQQKRKGAIGKSQKTIPENE
ncbi:hypothetical protein VNO78_28697 [Psophocarpus tetragonolobus]|uniref:Uncharacterized protein n=1 Tax=Psophocarpus tetragonolobus TaxID=3891 RepID=A0AAN9RTQ8_PSOTE